MENNKDFMEVTEGEEMEEVMENEFETEETTKVTKKEKFNIIKRFKGLKTWQKIAVFAALGLGVGLGYKGFKTFVKLVCKKPKAVVEAIEKVEATPVITEQAFNALQEAVEAAPEVTETVVETVTEVVEN